MSQHLLPRIARITRRLKMQREEAGKTDIKGRDENINIVCGWSRKSNQKMRVNITQDTSAYPVINIMTSDERK
jgi:hypothetical protein